MSTRSVTCAVCLGCAAYLASEALPRPALRQLASSNPAAAAHAKPQNEPSESGAADEERDAHALLDQALARLQAMSSLRVTIWQKMYGAHAFEAHSVLTLAPNGCARLEMKVHAGAELMEQLVISDGYALATIQRRPGLKEKVRGQTLPLQRGRRAQVLAAHGCAGPGALVKQLRDGVGDWRVRRDDSGDLVRLSGRLDPGRSAGSHLIAQGATVGELEVDATTLWPRRIAWRGGDERTRDERGPGRLILEMEFRDPETERALSAEECARLFTYTPQ